MRIQIERLKEPGSAITHFIAMLAAITGAIWLMVKVEAMGDIVAGSCFIFMASMILLYGASAAYHSFDVEPRLGRILKKLDHTMIFVLIAGTYTPVCLLMVGGQEGNTLLLLVWCAAFVGILFKLFWVTCPKWLSSVVYIVMGWMCVLVFTPLMRHLSMTEFALFVLGGIIYTDGGILYAMESPEVKEYNERHKSFGTHEIFHLFVMVGSLCHFMMVYHFVTR